MLTGIVICFMLIDSLVSAQMPDDLVGYWPLDEGAGDGAEDKSGNSNDADIMGNVEWVDGRFGSALEFFGSGGSTFIVQDSESLKITGPLTIEAWFYPMLDSQKGGIITKYKGAGDNRGYMIDIYDRNLRFILSEDGTRDTNITVSTQNWKAEEWYHVAGVFDGSVMYFYLNGTLIGKQNKTTGINPTTSPLELGNSWEEKVFTGIIDEVRIWNTAKNEDQIKTLMGGPEALLAVEANDKLAVTWGILKAE
jgi:hypothetical protein